MRDKSGRPLSIQTPLCLQVENYTEIQLEEYTLYQIQPSELKYITKA